MFTQICCNSFNKVVRWKVAPAPYFTDSHLSLLIKSANVCMCMHGGGQHSGWAGRVGRKFSFWTAQLTTVTWAPKHLYYFILCKPRRRQLPVTYLPELALAWCCQVFPGLKGSKVSNWTHCALSHLPNSHFPCLCIHKQSPSQICLLTTRIIPSKINLFFSGAIIKPAFLLSLWELFT